MKNRLRNLALVMPLIGMAIPAIATAQETKTQNVEVRLASEIDWQKLNPARGEASPQAGTIWGDQTKDGESGFLVKFVDGFSSPPHIHNITYRGIVIGGGLHNDDPDAETDVDASRIILDAACWRSSHHPPHVEQVLVMLKSSPARTLVMPDSEAFDNGERPINADATNIVWLDASNTTWIEGEVDSDASKNAQMTFMWGAAEGEQVNGTMAKLPAGFSGKLNSESSSFKVIVIEGQTKLHLDGGDDVKTLTAGGYFGSEGKSSHHVTCESESTIYVRTKGKYSVVPE